MEPLDRISYLLRLPGGFLSGGQILDYMFQILLLRFGLVDYRRFDLLEDLL